MNGFACENGMLGTPNDVSAKSSARIKFYPQQTDIIKKEIQIEAELEEGFSEEINLLKTLSSSNSRIVKQIRGGSKCSEVTLSNAVP